MANEEKIRAVVRSCPSADNGVNVWFYTAARRLRRLGVTDETRLEELLEEGSADCGREIRSDEIPRAVRNSAFGAKRSQHRRWPCRNYEQIEAIGRAGVSAAALEKSSPVRFLDAEDRAEEIIDALFPGNPLLCAGASLVRARTRPRDEWRGSLGRQQFIVPSPMLKALGMTAEGKSSARSLDNTGPRRFLVVEFDFSETNNSGRDTEAAPLLRRLAADGVTISDLCAALHAELAKLRPLALVLHSGGKSLHGWYPCDGEDESVMLRFMRFAVSLGADRATWTPAQFIRMPDGRRGNGKRQRVLYYNPAVLDGGSK